MSPGFSHPRVAVVGAGDVGRGWAALALAAGWPVALYDAHADATLDAAEEIGRRVAALERRGHAVPGATAALPERLRVGRSLLQAVTDADWIIEAAPEELHLKQRLLEQIEQVARRAAIVTSSSSGLHASDLVARLRRPERVLVAHPLNPVELLPVIEVVPGPATDPHCVEDVRAWLLRLDRVPIVLKKEIAGNAVGRIAAAVWRESIHLVLEGVIDVEDMDRLVALGPSLGWAAAGPHLTYHVGAGGHGVEVFLANLLRTFESWWADLATWDRLEPEAQAALVRAIERAYGARIDGLRAERDARLARLLDAVRPGPHAAARSEPPSPPPVPTDPTRPLGP
ncbi:MAG TPA: 3-hydroxyacyl-CoA dehydrogenase NAD-binding domain-containing protein [Gemmatimonadales bacterium]|nr:3-hydroxyacyl-CoA dehydrogenase NAD-binding domain-containing protein [Gemmatimonadales bacterium]